MQTIIDHLLDGFIKPEINPTSGGISSAIVLFLMNQVDGGTLFRLGGKRGYGILNDTRIVVFMGVPKDWPAVIAIRFEPEDTYVTVGDAQFYPDEQYCQEFMDARERLIALRRAPTRKES